LVVVWYVFPITCRVDKEEVTMMERTKGNMRWEEQRVKRRRKRVQWRWKWRLSILSPSLHLSLSLFFNHLTLISSHSEWLLTSHFDFLILPFSASFDEEIEWKEREQEEMRLVLSLRFWLASKIEIFLIKSYCLPTENNFRSAWHRLETCYSFVFFSSCLLFYPPSFSRLTSISLSFTPLCRSWLSWCLVVETENPKERGASTATSGQVLAGLLHTRFRERRVNREVLLHSLPVININS
jgi:hypothetical protein